MDALINNLNLLPVIFIAVFFCILFIQSGLDKIIDFHGNLNYFKIHFENSIFKKWVKSLLIIIAILESCTGFLFFIALFLLALCQNPIDFKVLVAIGLGFSALTICCLFLGQRLAKDYPGAANLTIYFLAVLLAFFFVL